MSDETTTKPAPQKIHRARIGLNVLAQVVLVLIVAAFVNSIGLKHYKRWDYSRDQKYSLSDKTKSFLQSIKGKVRITIFFSPDVPIATDVQNLLTEYQYAAKGKIDIENIDPSRNLSRAKEMFDKYKVVSEESLIVIDYEGRNKTVKASEMAEIDQSGMAMGEGPRIAAFKGEQAITSAMIDLVEGKKNALGYVLGHKEPPIGTESPVSVLKTFIENENVKFQELNFSDVSTIPADLKTIVIDGPQYDFSDREMKLLRDFWEKQGRILLLLEPSAKTPKLNAFLAELGVKVNDDRLMVFLRTGIEERAVTRDVYAHFLPGSPITKRLASVNAIFPGGTSSLTLEAERMHASNIKLVPLLQAEKGYFAETDYNTTDQAKLQSDAVKAGDAVFIIGVSIEKGGSGDEHVQVNSSRMVVVSNATFVQDVALTRDQQSLDFMSASANWLLSREQLIGIAPKVPKTLTFALDESALRNLRWLILVLMPLVPAVIGAAVWWQRRA
ncbi:MAG: gliding motility-associatede transport system auxiliary component [Verrucomicrobiota bacterium]